MTLQKHLKQLGKDFIDKGYDAGIKEGNIDYPEFTDYPEITEAAQSIEKDIEEILGNNTDFKWVKFIDVDDNRTEIEQDNLDPDAFQFLVCSVCGHFKNDPESGHNCELEDRIKSELRLKLKEYVGTK